MIILMILTCSVVSGDVGDGIITEDEYDHTLSLGNNNFIVHWKVYGETIQYGIEAQTTGWVSLGFDPEDVMEGADMIFGWVTTGGEVKALDCYSEGIFGPHPPDTELGGSGDILKWGGSEKQGKTIFEFERNLSVTDEYDKSIPTEGDFTIIWAAGATDDFTSKHTMVGEFQVDFSKKDIKVIVIFWPIHAILMGLAFILMGTGMVIARFMKKQKWWLLVHRRLELIGSVMGIAGITFLSAMIFLSGESHLKIPHSLLGAMAGLCFLGTLILGFFIFKIKIGKKKLKSIHRWCGRMAILLAGITILLGLLHVF